MPLAKVQLARSIWLFDVSELNPFGANFEPLYNVIIQRYGFTGLPKPEDAVTGSSKYGSGKFLFGEQIIDVSLEIHSDGLIADTRHSTDASDIFLQDLLTLTGDHFHVKYPPRMAKKRAYRSELIVYADRGMEGLCEKLDRFAKILSSLTSSKQELNAVVFGSESKNSAFTFERKINAPFEENRFYSAALMPSGDHLALLYKFEDLLKSPGRAPSA